MSLDDARQKADEISVLDLLVVVAESGLSSCLFPSSPLEVHI